MLGLLIGLFIGSFIWILFTTLCAMASRDYESPSYKKNMKADEEGESIDECWK